MSAPLRNPVTGQFTPLDPVPGGNTTVNTYPQNPINMYDLNDLCWAGFGWACERRSLHRPDLSELGLTPLERRPGASERGQI